MPGAFVRPRLDDEVSPAVTISRSFRRQLSRLMVGVLLFAQLAVSGFACQAGAVAPVASMPLAGHGAPAALGGGRDAVRPHGSHAGEADAGERHAGDGHAGDGHAAGLHHVGLIAPQASDPGAALADTHCGDAGVDTPNLCFEHCRDGASTPSQASGVPDFGLALVGGVTLPLGDPAQPAGHFAPVRFGIEPGTPPPHAILHCCLRT